MAKGCLYCSLQLPETAEFCPRCGRPIERGFVVRPIQESEFDCLRKEMKRKDDLLELEAVQRPRRGGDRDRRAGTPAAGLLLRKLPPKVEQLIG
jgi:hypothetical protein